MARTQNGELLNTLQAGFKYIENESFQSTFSGLFSEINLGSDKLGKTYADPKAKLCTIITKIAGGLKEFSTDSDTLGDAYEYLIGQFAAGSNSFSQKIRTGSFCREAATALRYVRSRKRGGMSDSVAFFCSSSAYSALRRMCSMRTPHASLHIFLKTSRSPDVRHFGGTLPNEARHHIKAGRKDDKKRACGRRCSAPAWTLDRPAVLDPF
jgi:hypothetical protein